MKRPENKYVVKGFTIAEVLITLVLTSLAITFSYTTLSYTQKLFYGYKTQNKFINEYTDLKKRMNYEGLKSDMVIEESENRFSILRDSVKTSLEILDQFILIKRKDQCDTFHISAKNIRKEYTIMKNPVWTNKLLSSLEFDTDYTKQVFHFSFYKNYEASIKLKLDKEE